MHPTFWDENWGLNRQSNLEVIGRDMQASGNLVARLDHSGKYYNAAYRSG
jgi:hypothetical protein